MKGHLEGAPPPLELGTRNYEKIRQQKADQGGVDPPDAIKARSSAKQRLTQGAAVPL